MRFLKLNFLLPLSFGVLLGMSAILLGFALYEAEFGEVEQSHLHDIDELTERDWILELVAQQGAPFSMKNEESPPTITFSGSEVSGFAGCNHYSGSVTLRGPYTLVIEVLAKSLRDCPEGENMEMFFFDLLGDPMTFRVSADKLELFSTVSDTVLTFSKDPNP